MNIFGLNLDGVTELTSDWFDLSPELGINTAANKTYLGRILGRGLENTCYEIVDENGRTKEPRRVLKIPHLAGKLWQTDGPEFAERTVHSMHQNGILLDPTLSIKENVLIVMPDGMKKIVPYAIETDFIENIEEKTLKYEDITHTTELETLYRVASILQSAYGMRSEDKLGLDPFGGEILKEFLHGIPRGLILKFFAQFSIKTVRDFVRGKIGNIQGQLRNFIKTERGLECIDTGAHDLARRKIILILTHLISMGGLKALIRKGNENLGDNKLSPTELEELLENPDIENESLLMRASEKVMDKLAIILMDIMSEVYENKKAEAK